MFRTMSYRLRISTRASRLGHSQCQQRVIFWYNDYRSWEFKRFQLERREGFMIVRTSIALLMCNLTLSSISSARDGLPDKILSHATTAASVEVLLYSVPDGSGTLLSEAVALDAIVTDATVTLTLVDSQNLPIWNFPFEDLWIDVESGSFVACPGGTVADHNTDQNGQTTWSGALFAGGHGTGLRVFVNGESLEQSPLLVRFNSSDINADLVVNLADVVLFAQTFQSGLGYDWKMDFNWDEVMNLADIVYQAQAMGAACP
jgi:hypothetical protein